MRIVECVKSTRNIEGFIRTAFKILISKSLMLDCSWRQYKNMIAINDSDFLKAIIGMSKDVIIFCFL